MIFVPFFYRLDNILVQFSPAGDQVIMGTLVFLLYFSFQVHIFEDPSKHLLSHIDQPRSS